MPPGRKTLSGNYIRSEHSEGKRESVEQLLRRGRQVWSDSRRHKFQVELQKGLRLYGEKCVVGNNQTFQGYLDNVGGSIALE